MLKIHLVNVGSVWFVEAVPPNAKNPSEHVHLGSFNNRWKAEEFLSRLANCVSIEIQVNPTE